MDYKRLAEVNAKMETINIKDKQYVKVNERIKAFRELEPNGTISTEILALDETSVTVQTTIKDEEGHVLATGISHEDRSDSNINRTSMFENAETSAVGRALGMCGIGVDGNVASYEEVLQAMAQQELMDKGRKTPARSKNAAQRATANDKRTPEEINAARIIELAKLRGVEPEKIQEAIVGSVEHPEDAAAVSKKLDEWLAIIEKNGGGQA